MEAKETVFLKFLQIPMQLIIPIYQRKYSWDRKQCQELLSDIKRAGSDDDIQGHFIGSIVYVEKGLYGVSKLDQLLVIDGQQRLTTLSLLILALCNKIKENSIQTDADPKKLQNYYLFNDQESEEEKYKLILTKSDKDVYLRLLSGLPLSENKSSKIKENYEFIREQISQTDVDVIYKGLQKLVIIDVSLDREKDNPQLIFESLNSTGLELTQADLIRNYILMGLEKEKQAYLYENYWHPMEKMFGQSENTSLFDRFIRNYLTIKLNRIPTLSDIYVEFKEYSKKFDEIEDLVSELFEYSEYFIKIALEKEDDSDIRKVFREINELKVDVSYSFILSLYKDYTNEKISKEDFMKILGLIESYVFRRSICGIPTSSLNKTFGTLYKQIDKANYLQSTQAIFILFDSYRRLPTNAEFEKELLTKDVYNFTRRNYILRKLENFGRKETIEVEGYTIEHIMPQNPRLSEEWKQDLGENWKEIQKNYLHTIGNLTLTQYNPDNSDKPFQYKRDLKDKQTNEIVGFKGSPLSLNKFLGDLNTWNEEKIKKRANILIQKAIKIWSYPQLSKEDLEKYKIETQKGEIRIYTLKDHEHIREGELMNPIFEDLRKRILNIDSSVKEVPKKLYIAYKSGTNFVDIIPQQKALILSLSIPFQEIKDPEEKCRDVSMLGRWGTGDTELKICSVHELDYALKLIKQAFEHVVNNGSEN